MCVSIAGETLHGEAVSIGEGVETGPRGSPELDTQVIGGLIER